MLQRLRLTGVIRTSKKYTHNRRGQQKCFPFAGGTISLTGPVRIGPRGGQYLDATVCVRKGSKQQTGKCKLYSGQLATLGAGIYVPLFVTWSNGQTHNIGTVQLRLR